MLVTSNLLNAPLILALSAFRDILNFENFSCVPQCVPSAFRYTHALNHGYPAGSFLRSPRIFCGFPKRLLVRYNMHFLMHFLIHSLICSPCIPSHPLVFSVRSLCVLLYATPLVLHGFAFPVHSLRFPLHFPFAAAAIRSPVCSFKVVANKDTMSRTQIFPCLPARATFVSDDTICVRDTHTYLLYLFTVATKNLMWNTHKMFLIFFFGNILCLQHMFPGLCCMETNHLFCVPLVFSRKKHHEIHQVSAAMCSRWPRP